MRTKNYLTINEENVVQLHGFEDITDYIYVELFEKKRQILLLTRKRPLKTGCFEVSVTPERTVNEPRFKEIIVEYGLVGKRFWGDERFGNYLSTDILV